MTGPARIAVVVPTRNRSVLAARAARSVIQDAEGSVSLFVSDNSTDPGESEQLSGLCAELGEAAVAYLRPPTPLPMTKHWEWAAHEALERSGASHLVFLTDRMIFKPGAVSDLIAIAAEHPRAVVSYNHDTVLDHVHPIRLRLEPWSGLLVEIPSERLLFLSSRGVIHASLPRMLNCVVPREVLTAVEDLFGTLFASISPDFCFAFRCLATVDSVLFWDSSPLVQHGLDVSHGSTYARGVRSEARQDFAEQLGELKMNFAAPVPEFQTIRNAIIHEYSFVRAESGSDRFPPVDPRGYLAAVVEDLSMFESRKARRQMLDVLADNGWVGAPKRRYDAGMLMLRAMFACWDLARAGSRVVGRFAPGAHFATTEEALAHAERSPRAREEGLAHLPAFADLPVSAPPVRPTTPPSP
jgi:hypothetical protein